SAVRISTILLFLPFWIRFRFDRSSFCFCLVSECIKNSRLLCASADKAHQMETHVSASGAETALAVEQPLAVTVLIVDDEDATRNLCRDVVADSGLQTRTASTTGQALEILDRTPID